MRSSAQPGPVPGPVELRNPRLWLALALLREALDAAGAAGRDPWEFAIEVGQLRARGLTNTDLRWLLCQGYVEHAQELPGADSGRRSFRAVANLALPEQSCFILTAAGAAVVLRQAEGRLCPSSSVRGKGRAARRPRPRWDGRSRQLCWQGCVVKHFRVPAANQEAILAALEEEGWPDYIDDPLPPADDLDPKARLHDAIKGLNRHQVQPLLQFRGDGTGRGVLWRPTTLP